MTLGDSIAEEILRHGAIPFSRFMELCLYHPKLGYYARPGERFGRGGDFYTASDVSAIYGRLLARQFEEIWRALGAPAPAQIIELGPGRGMFAEDALAWSERHFAAFNKAMRYHLVESSPALRARLKERFAREIASARVWLHESLATLPRSESAILFANEFFDALPVEVLSERGELVVGMGDEGGFIEGWREARPEVLAFADRFAMRPRGSQRIEVSLQLAPVLKSVAQRFAQVVFVVVDYGYTRQELAGGRPGDTLRAFREHSLRADVLQAAGEQDITASVNFSALAGLAAEAGMQAMPLVTQAQFLLGLGQPTQFAEAFEGCTFPQEHAKRALQLKHLIAPEAMGEVFRVLLLYKGVPREAVAALAGMEFAR